MRRLLLWSALLLALLPTLSPAAITEQGYGIIYGENHAFALTAPPGWVLDNESGAGQGLHAVFYPVGQAWADAEAVAYANTADRDAVTRDVPSLVKFTVENFHANGSPHYRSRFIKDLPLAHGGRTARIYHFEGDAWGNYEAVGYVEEEKTIHFVVLTSRTRKAFDAALPAFERLVASYLFVTKNVILRPSP